MRDVLISRKTLSAVWFIASREVLRRTCRRPIPLLVAAILLALSAAGAFAQTVTLSPSALKFGDEVVGATSAVKKVSLTNTGASALSIASIAASADFAQTNTCGSSVAAGARCMISVTFTPAAAQAYTGAVTITDNTSGSPQAIALSGSGISSVTLSATQLTFTSRTIGTTSNPLSVTLTNNLTTALGVTGISVTGDFAQTNTCGSSVAAGQQCSISTTFTPTASGVRSGALTITDSANNSPQAVTLSGTGSTAGLLSIAVTPANPSVSTGATQQFHATGTFAGGTTYDLTESVTWGSSATRVATVSNLSGSQGLATALATGTTTIKAINGKISGSTTLTVGASLQSITLAPLNATVSLGTGQQFTATGNYSNGTTQNLTNSVTWTSSTPNIATITSTGLATSIATGTTTISAASGSVSASATLTVNPAALLSIAVTPANATAALGTTQQYDAVGTYSDGSTLDLTTTTAWSSTATVIATISNSLGTQGLASTGAIGATNIVAALGTISGSTPLTVTPAALTTIVLSPAQASIPVGTTQQFTATGIFTDGTTQNLTSTAIWSSSATTISTISNGPGTQGLATTIATGTSTITAISGGETASSLLTVTAALVSITVTPASPMLAPGTTQQFTALGTFSDGTTQDVTSSSAWSSSDLIAATISSTGLATTVASGTSTITATDGAVSGSTPLIVTQALLVSIAVTPSTASIAAGSTQQFTATGTFSDSSMQDITASAYWSSSNGAVATVSDTPGSQGLSSGVSSGSVTITAASGSISGAAALVVTGATLTSISLAPQNPSIALGATQQFTATGTYSDGTSNDVTLLATWTSSSSAVAIVSNATGSIGLATSVGIGQSTITATLGTISSSTTLTVASPSLVSIAITPANLSLTTLAAQQMTATGTYSDGSTQNLTASALWSSSASNFATVTAAGLATGVSAGTSTITAAEGSISASIALTVTSVTLPLGTVSSNGSATCPTGGAPGEVCTSVTVSCPGIPSIKATIGVATPTGTPKGTVILHAGGSGTQFLDFGFPESYSAAGFNSVQIAWGSDWAAAAGVGVKTAACRPATLFQYIFTTVHQSSRSAGFCGQGSSGGGATLGYALADYGLNDYFDYVVIAAGPGLARMDYGCDGSLYTGPPLNVCSSLTNAPYIYATRSAQQFNTWENTTSCESPNPLASDIARWNADSIVTEGANFSYPQTAMSWFTCTTPPVNESTGQGEFLIEQVVPKNTSPDVNCYSGICQGEIVWNDPNAVSQTVSEMQTNCVPNHQ